MIYNGTHVRILYMPEGALQDGKMVSVTDGYWSFLLYN